MKLEEGLALVQEQLQKMIHMNAVQQEQWQQMRAEPAIKGHPVYNVFAVRIEWLMRENEALMKVSDGLAQMLRVQAKGYEVEVTIKEGL